MANFIERIAKDMVDAIERAKCESDYCACVSFECDSAVIDCAVTDDNYKEVNIYHKNYSDNDNSCIVEAIKNALPDWDDVEFEPCDMWQSHGFKDISDYNKYINC